MSTLALLDHYQAPEDWWRVNMVLSLDGHYVDAQGTSRGLSCPADLRVMLSLRATSDCIVVGAATLRSERYVPGSVHSEFEEHGLHGPRVAVVTRTFDLAENNPALTGDTPLLVLAAQHDADTHSQRIAHLGSRIELCQAPADVTGTWIRDTLTEHGLSRVVCEGGPAVVGLLRRDCVLDELDVTIAPVLVGAKHRQPAMGDDAGRVSVLSRAQAGDHTFLRCVIDDATPTLV